MFAGLLNKGFRGSLLLLIVFLVSAGVASYFSVNSLENSNFPDLFYNYFKSSLQHQGLVTLCNYVFITGGLLLISLITINQEIADKQNYFPVFLYMLLTTVGANPLELSPQLFTNVLLLFSFYKLLDTYRQQNVLKQVFDAALWISVSTFISISDILYFPLFFISLSVLRPFNWREWAIGLLGLLVPIFLYECMAYLSSFNQWYLLKAGAQYFYTFKTPSFSEYYLAFSLTLLILLLLALAQVFLGGPSSSVKKQRSKWILFWFILFAFPGIFSNGTNSADIILNYSIPLSFLIGDFLFNLRQIKITNTLLSILLLSGLLIFLGKLGII